MNANLVHEGVLVVILNVPHAPTQEQPRRRRVAVSAGPVQRRLCRDIRRAHKDDHGRCSGWFRIIIATTVSASSISFGAPDIKYGTTRICLPESHALE